MHEYSKHDIIDAHAEQRLQNPPQVVHVVAGHFRPKIRANLVEREADEIIRRHPVIRFIMC